ncbi:MAG TPA: tRNA (guanosine(37)-N1)-methyltransferase TrmD [Tepidiformaceae bacterium]|nr:tRNA (guanosine(37)-N1)-methyltransferase TrmD [Tepidiformaceae bacterium]
MRVDVLTLFPEAFAGPLDVSILRRAREAGLLDLHLHDIRDFGAGPHRSVDDYPFGGGQGMVLRVDVLDAALRATVAESEATPYVIYLTPQGERLDDRMVRELARHDRLILVCGRYEGVDERFVEQRVDREVSIGDYVMTGGELPAMVLIDAVTRHVPGALGDEESPEDESFARGLLEHAQYTRPAEYEGWRVPEVLLGGDHAAIGRWRDADRVERTRVRRPDLLPELAEGDRSKRKVGIDGVRIRELDYPRDLPGLLELWTATEGIELSASDVPAELAKLVGRDPGLCIVAESGGQVVGTLLAGFDGRRGRLYHLAVEQPERARGIGSALMLEIENRLAERGCIRAHLHVVARNEEAEHFYLRRGWVRMDVTAWGKNLRP